MLHHPVLKKGTPPTSLTRPRIWIMWAPYPEPIFYGAYYTSPDVRAQFLEWCGGQKDKIFRNKEDLLAFSMYDVNVLRQVCCAFRNLFLKLLKMDPFRQAITIFSICIKVFRTIFLKTDTAGIIPKGGTVWEIASLLKLLNCWCTLVNQGTTPLMPAMGGRYISIGF